MDPVPGPPNAFAVDGKRLRFAHFSRHETGFDLVEYRQVDLEPELFATGPLGGPLHDPVRFRSALEQLQGATQVSVDQASLVLPDSWLRMAIADSEELPKSTQSRDEVLRWKLQRIVPFRVEELRIRGVDSVNGYQGSEARRVVLGFGLETLLRQLEGVFDDFGIHVGSIANESLCLLSGVEEALRDVELSVVALVSAGGYSLSFIFRGEPILHRFKALPQMAGDEPPHQMIDRDLHLTRVYLADQIGEVTLGRVLLICPPELEKQWQDWLGNTFELPVHSVGPENLVLDLADNGVPIHELVTLFGAARQEIG